MTDCMEGQVSLFAPGSWSGKTSAAPSHPTADGISKRSSRNASGLPNRAPLMCLRLRKENGPAPVLSWETDGASLGVYSTRNTGECPNEENVSRLSAILEDNPPPKFSLSAKAAMGILRRAERRCKELPEPLKTALIRQSRGIANV